MKIKVVIQTKNEEEKIVECVEKAKQFTDDVLVIDSGSTDNTAELAKQAGAKVTVDNEVTENGSVHSDFVNEVSPSEVASFVIKKFKDKKNDVMQLSKEKFDAVKYKTQQVACKFGVDNSKCSNTMEQLEQNGIGDRFATYFVRFATVVLILMLVNLDYKPHYSVAMIAYVLAVGVFCYRNRVIPRVDISTSMSYSLWIFLVTLFICALFTGSVSSNLVGVFKQFYAILPFFMLLSLNSLVDVRREIKYSLACVAVFQFVYMGYDFVVNKIPRPEGLFWNTNASADMIGLMLPFFVYQVITTESSKNRWFWGVITIIDFLALCMTKCRGELLAIEIIFIPVGLWLIYRYSREDILLGIAVALGICVVGYGLFDWRGSSDLHRIYVYKSAFNMWKDHMLFGVGFSEWSMVYNSVYRIRMEVVGLAHAHNLYLTFLSASGIVGTIAFLQVFVRFFALFYKQIVRENMYYLVGLVGILIFLIHSLVDSTYSIFFVARFVWLMFAVYLINFGTRNDENKIDCVED